MVPGHAQAVRSPRFRASTARRAMARAAWVGSQSGSWDRLQRGRPCTTPPAGQPWRTGRSTRTTTPPSSTHGAPTRFVCQDSNPTLVAQRQYRRRYAYILRSILDDPKPAHPPALNPQPRASRRHRRGEPGRVLHGLCVISLGPVGYPCAGTIPSPEVSARLPARVSAMPRPRSSGDRAPLS